jgi:NAD(P)-dependent dehydrogenase (short-subunit alcohol dehydrogenase family)
MNTTQSVVLVTGASSGFGRATAQRLVDAGMVVYGTSRKATDRSQESAALRMLAMDVCDDASVAEGVARIIAEQGRIDVVVNNAGISVCGSIEDTSIEEAQLQLDTNFFGALRVIRCVLPHMRRARRGKIINVSSIGGLMGLPFQGLYSASKFALEGLTEALRMEVKAFGVDVVNVNPGDFHTGMTSNRIFTQHAATRDYAEQLAATLAVYEHDEINGSDPVLVAELIEKLISTSSPKVRYLVGMRAQKAGAWLKRVVGSRSFERVMQQHCKIG